MAKTRGTERNKLLTHATRMAGVWEGDREGDRKSFKGTRLFIRVLKEKGTRQRPLQSHRCQTSWEG